MNEILDMFKQEQDFADSMTASTHYWGRFKLVHFLFPKSDSQDHESIVVMKTVYTFLTSLMWLLVRSILPVSPWKSETEMKTERKWIGKPQSYTLFQKLCIKWDGHFH